MNNHFVSIIRRCELSYVRGEMEKYGVIPLEGRLIRILKDKSCSPVSYTHLTLPTICSV